MMMGTAVITKTRVLGPREISGLDSALRVYPGRQSTNHVMPQRKRQRQSLWIFILIILSTVFVWNGIGVEGHPSGITCNHDDVAHPAFARSHLRYADYPSVMLRNNAISKYGAYRPIRMHVDWSGFNSTVTNEPMRDHFAASMVLAQQFFTKTLFVLRVSGNAFYGGRTCTRYAAGVTNAGKCSAAPTASTCGNQAIPEAHFQADSQCSDGADAGTCTAIAGGAGVADADIIIYMLSDAAQCSGTTLATAAACSLDQKDRPVSGYVNICPAALVIPANAFQNQRDVSLLMHELTHVLGFSKSLYPYFRDELGYPFTPRDANGAPTEQSHYSTLRTTTERGGPVTRFVLPQVRAQVQNHFGCSSVSGGELEDGGGAGTATSHWEHRVFNTEYMIGARSETHRSMATAMSLALLQDSGWYKANFSAAETMQWGRNWGCSFLNDACLTAADNPYSNYDDTWCAVDAAPGCTWDRHYKGTCVTQMNVPLPPVYQQWWTGAPHGRGGLNELMDYCPMITPASNGLCTDENNLPPGENVNGRSYGANTMCFESTLMSALYGEVSSKFPECYLYRCGANSVLEIGVSIYTYKRCGDRTPLTFESQGYNGNITCPSLVEQYNMCQPVGTVHEWERNPHGLSRAGNIPPSGGVSVTIFGNLFGHERTASYHAGGNTSQLEVTVTSALRFGGTGSESSKWLTHTTCTVKVPGRKWTLTAWSVHATIANSVQTISSLFTVDASAFPKVVRGNSPPTGAVTTTLVGNIFGVYDLSQTRHRLGGTGSESTTWMSESALLCKVAQGGGFPLISRTTLAGQMETTSKIWGPDYPCPAGEVVVLGECVDIYAPPVILTTSVENTTAVPQTNNSNTTSPPTTMVATTTTAVFQTSTATATTAALPEAAVSQELGWVPVYDQPDLLSGDSSGPTNSPATGALNVVLLGSGGGMRPWSDGIRLSATNAETSRWSSDTLCYVKRCSSPNPTMILVSADRIVRSQRFGMSMNNEGGFLLPAMNIVTSGALSVTLFGATPAFGMGVCRMSRVGSTTITATSWYSSTVLVGKLPSTLELPAFGSLSVQFGASRATTQHFFSMAPSEYVTDFQGRSQKGTGSSYITIIGARLAPRDYSALFRVGGTACEATTWQSVSTMLARWPSGVNQEGMALYATLPKRSGTHSRYFSYDVPHIHGLIGNGPKTGSNSVVIVMWNAGHTDPSTRVRVGATPMAGSDWVSDTTIRVKPSPMVEVAGLIITATLARTKAGPKSRGTGQSLFVWDKVFTRNTTHPWNNSPATGGVDVTCHGAGFGETHNSRFTRLGGTGCEAGHWQSDSSAKCKTPIGTRGWHDIALTQNTGSVTMQEGFQFNDFSWIDNVWRSTSATTNGIIGLPLTGSAMVTVFGTDLGTVPNSIQFRPGFTANEGATWVSTTVMRVKSATGFGSIPMLASMRGYDGDTRHLNGINNAEYGRADIMGGDCPTGQEVRHSECNQPHTGSITVRVIGENMAHIQACTASRMGHTGTSAVQWSSASSIVFKSTPQNYQWTPKTKIVITAHTDRPGSTATRFLTYDQRSLEKISKTNYPIEEGNILQIYGDGWSEIDPTVEIRIGWTVSLSSRWVSDTIITGLMRKENGAMFHLTPTIQRAPRSLTNAFSYDGFNPTVLHPIAAGDAIAQGPGASTARLGSGMTIFFPGGAFRGNEFRVEFATFALYPTNGDTYWNYTNYTIEKPVSETWHISPEGSEFLAPIRIRMYLNASLFNVSDNLRIQTSECGRQHLSMGGGYLAADIGEWVTLETEFGEDGSPYVEARDVRHFSYFVVVEFNPPIWRLGMWQIILIGIGLASGFAFAVWAAWRWHFRKGGVKQLPKEGLVWATDDDLEEMRLHGINLKVTADLNNRMNQEAFPLDEIAFSTARTWAGALGYLNDTEEERAKKKKAHAFGSTAVPEEEVTEAPPSAFKQREGGGLMWALQEAKRVEAAAKKEDEASKPPPPKPSMIPKGWRDFTKEAQERIKEQVEAEEEELGRATAMALAAGATKPATAESVSNDFRESSSHNASNSWDDAGLDDDDEYGSGAGVVMPPMPPQAVMFNPSGGAGIGIIPGSRMMSSRHGGGPASRMMSPRGPPSRTGSVMMSPAGGARRMLSPGMGGMGGMGAGKSRNITWGDAA